MEKSHHVRGLGFGLENIFKPPDWDLQKPNKWRSLNESANSRRIIGPFRGHLVH